MRRFLRVFFVAGSLGFSLLGESVGRIAVLKANDIYLTDASGGNPIRVGSDPRQKWALRWDGNRKKLSYLVPGEHGDDGEKARLVELDPDGTKVMEVAIPHDDGMRFVEDFEWLPNGDARLGGSVNPRNCVLYDLNPESGKITHGVNGKCGSFVRSPDGKHTAELGVIPQTDDDHRFDAVDFDSQPGFGPAAYGGGGHDVFIPAGPIWSPDSRSVVFVEKRADSSEAGVVFLTLAKVATRVPVPAFVLDNPSIAWIGSKVVVGTGEKAVQIDPVTKRLSAVTSDVSDEIARKTSAKRAADAARTRVDDLVKRMGGREGVLLDMGGAK